MVVYGEPCRFCGNTEFVHGVQTGYAAISGDGLLSGAALKHVICRKCGSVVRSYVDDPEKLLKKSDRRNKPSL